ncbi:AfsR/SARP family transcriptional regulator [Phycicoccus jejuensis]|uniref:AfsR/SARP family transcriptional regulator n=1 Tax=Phycicoccus jejuensis TaxID=367299 RepID=UPI0004C362D9|nr:BTAD domain-containing putative transcriptional regulator [Phycicoccus jejuensis]
MYLEVLGRLRLTGPSGPLRLTELESGLLALAALRDQVDVDSLGTWLWDGEPPASARNRVQALVSGIRRKAEGIQVLVTDGRGYRLADRVERDVAVWADRLAAARRARATDPVTALELYDRALATFVHEPLLGPPATAAVEVERNRLVQERLSVLEERHETALRAGVLQGLVAELDALSARHPFHEGFTALLVQALAATGQQRRALQVFHAARERLDRELGVRPSDALAGALQAVLTGSRRPASRPGSLPADDAPAPPAALPVPRTLPRRPDVVVGRAAEVDRVLRAAAGLEHAAVVVSVTGLPGTGKSTLALEAGHALRDRFPGGTLHHDGGNLPGGTPVETLVTTFLPLLGVHPEGVPASTRARVGLLRSLLDARRVLLVLDNVAGDEDVARLADLLPAGAGSMALITSRRPLPGLAAGHHVRLGSLDPASSRRLLEELVGTLRTDEAPEATDEVVRLTGGLPLALRLAAGRLAQRPDLGFDDLAARLRGSTSSGHDLAVVHESLEGLVSGLLPPSRSALEALAHLPVDAFSGWVVGGVLGDPTAGEAALDALLEAGLVEPVVREGHDTQYRLHDLVRAHVRHTTRGDRPGGAGPSPSEVELLGSAAVARADAFLVDRPYRLVPVPQLPAAVAPPAPAPVVRRRSRRFFRTETPLFVALSRRLTPVRSDLAWRLLAQTALGTDASSDLHAWFEADREVRGALVGADDDSRLGVAHLLLCRAWLLQDRRSASAQARELAEAARRRLHLLGAHDAAAAASIVAALASVSLGHRADAERAVHAAETSIGRGGDATLAGWAAVVRGTLHNDYDELGPAAREFTRARRLLEDSPRTVAYALATLELSRVHRRTGELGPAVLLIDEALELLASIEAVHMYSYALDARAEVALANGRPQEALDDAQTALDRALTSHDAFLAARSRRTLARARLALGDLAGAESDLRTVIEEFTALERPLSVAFAYQVLADVLDATGDRVGAGEALRLEEQAVRRATQARVVAPRRSSPGPA